ncbi:MAG: UDP-N-acetylglucosamine 2-epimerase (non-hydrolyzing) [Flavobacteriales bacterium]|nr:UDP-N-acetylglucosamine 2-epimerase (non-hydrolyzing) [Flavobacteriales bacterium]
MVPLRLLTVVGARPQIIKAAAIARAVERANGRISQTMLHTGQHYDAGMSQVFFDQMRVPRADIDLGVGSGEHGTQTARMLEGIERVLQRKEHDAVLLFGDTNSTLAGALAAAKLHVPVAHVEAGLRSFNKEMPEEMNRIVCDHCSTWLFCPTDTAVANLKREGFRIGLASSPRIDEPLVLLTGDVMFDNSLHFKSVAEERSTFLRENGLLSDGFMLATVHRPTNTDDPARLAGILETLCEAARVERMLVVMPLHPRTRKLMDSGLPPALRKRLSAGKEVKLVPPVGFLDMIALESNARLVITDSGGVQKEAFFFRKPCVVLRKETEWVELVQHGQARLAGSDPAAVLSAIGDFLRNGAPACPDLYGDGLASDRICEALLA